MIPPLIPLVVVCLAYVLGCIALMTVEFREKLAFALLAASGCYPGRSWWGIRAGFLLEHL